MYLDPTALINLSRLDDCDGATWQSTKTQIDGSTGSDGSTSADSGSGFQKHADPCLLPKRQRFNQAINSLYNFLSDFSLFFFCFYFLERETLHCLSMAISGVVAPPPSPPSAAASGGCLARKKMRLESLRSSDL